MRNWLVEQNSKIVMVAVTDSIVMWRSVVQSNQSSIEMAPIEDDGDRAARSN